jgi:hypothetical protein
MICAAGQRTPTSRCIQSEIASRSSAMPLEGVYFVYPLRSASETACST